MDIRQLRDPDFVKIVKESQRKRYKSEELVDEVIKIDEQWRQVNYKSNDIRNKYKKIQKQITEKKKNKLEVPTELYDEKQTLETQLNEIEPYEKELKSNLDDKFSQIGNIVHSTVPISKNEEDNLTIKKVGEILTGSYKQHHELLKLIDGYSPEEGSAIAGHRGYFLKNIGVKLNQALINYALDFLEKRKFTLLSTPFFMNKSVMSKTAQLSDFDEQLYKVIGGPEDKYLIATSEQPISAYHMNQWINNTSLPLRYGGISTNFRKEAGGHGRDVGGIFRVHQFEKIEQFVITTPEKSWEMHEEMLKNAEEFYQSLGIAYRVVNIVSGELNDAAAKKYDLEGYFKGSGTFRELVSCSNCTDYQSRRLNITTGFPKRYVHMLNSTLCATSRTICVLLETYQTDTGIKIPTVLQSYLGGQDFIPFVVS